MTFLTAARRSISAAALLFTSATAAGAQTTITFDDVTTNSSGLNNNFSSNSGYAFFGFNVATATSLGSGSNAVSGAKFALGRTGGSAFYRTDVGFNLFTAWLSFRQFDLVTPDNSPVGITVFGFRAGVVDPVFEQLIMLTNVAVRHRLDFFDVEEIAFDTDALTANGRSVALAVDDAVVGVVPEPSTVVLSATGLLMLLIAVRRRNNTAA